MKELSAIQNAVWRRDILVVFQIREHMHSFANSKTCDATYLGFFKTFLSEMQNRYRIPSQVVERYKEVITLMVDKDNCYMEAVEP